MGFLSGLSVRTCFGLFVLFLLTSVGIYGWVSEGWMTGLSIVIGAISLFIFILFGRDAAMYGWVLGSVSLIIAVIGFFGFLNDSIALQKESLDAYDKAFLACSSGDSEGCQEGIKKFVCKDLESHQKLAQAAISAGINNYVPKEFSGIAEMSAQRNFNLMPSDCEKDQ